MKKITEITTEREFVSKLRTYYRKARRKGYQRNEISFLGLMEYTGSATREFEYQSDKYFSVGIRAYDWQYGNSLLSALIDKWENEIEAEKRKKQPTQPTETPQISTEAAETVNVSAEGEKEAERAENKPYYTHRWRVLHNCDLKTWDKFHKKHKEAILIFHHETTYTALQKEAVKVSEMCDIAYEVNRHGVKVCLFNDATLTQIIEQGIYVAIAELPKVPDYGLTDAPQSPEAPQIVECIADTPKPRETARKPQNRGIGNTRHSGLGTGGYAMLDNASATLAAMNFKNITVTLHKTNSHVSL